MHGKELDLRLLPFVSLWRLMSLCLDAEEFFTLHTSCPVEMALSLKGTAGTSTASTLNYSMQHHPCIYWMGNCHVAWSPCLHWHLSKRQPSSKWTSFSDNSSAEERSDLGSPFKSHWTEEIGLFASSSLTFQLPELGTSLIRNATQLILDFLQWTV